MKTFRELLESKPIQVKIKLFFDEKDSEILYSLTDGKNWLLNKDKSVHWSSSKLDPSDPNEKLGKPGAKNQEYDVIEYNKILGVWDSNMKLIQKYKNMKSLLQDIEDLLEEEEIELLNFSF